MLMEGRFNEQEARAGEVGVRLDEFPSACRGLEAEHISRLVGELRRGRVGCDELEVAIMGEVHGPLLAMLAALLVMSRYVCFCLRTYLPSTLLPGRGRASNL